MSDQSMRGSFIAALSFVLAVSSASDILAIGRQGELFAPPIVMMFDEARVNLMDGNQMQRLVAEIHSQGGTVTRRLWLINGLELIPPATPEQATQMWQRMQGAFGAVAFDRQHDERKRWLLPFEASSEPPAGSAFPWGIHRVGAPEAWPTGVTGAGVRVAVIDTGIDCNHPDLRGPNCHAGWNAVARNNNTFDDNAHGTHVAGTIAGQGRQNVNGKRVMGVAPGVSLFAVKVLDSEGSGTYGAIIEGIQWAVQNQIQLANMSLGGPHSPALQKAVERAAQSGLQIIAATGNNPYSPVSAPAMYPQVIAIGASNERDEVAPFSSRGQQVDFIMPGVGVLSTVPNGGYSAFQGTSMATPHATGMAALVYSGANTAVAMCQGAERLPGLDANMQGKGLVSYVKLRSNPNDAAYCNSPLNPSF